MTKQEQELKRHIEMLDAASTVEHGLIKIKENYKSAYEEWANYANSTQNTRTVFAMRDFNYLQDIYQKRIIELATIINNISIDKEEIIINTLEIMRILVTYDFEAGKNINSNKKYKNIGQAISGSGIIPAFTGRGICQNQAALCRDILNLLGIKAQTLPLTGKNDSHADVIIDNQIVIDPTNYKGNFETISGGKEMISNYNLTKYTNILNINEEKFKECTNKTKEKLINYLKINELCEEYKLDDFTEDEKQMIIWNLLAQKIVKTDKAENSYSVKIDKYELEITNALELLYYANNIPLKRRQEYVNGEIEHQYYAMFDTLIKGKLITIVTRKNIYMGENLTPKILPIGYTPNLSEIINLQELYINTKTKLEQNNNNEQQSTMK